MRGIVVMGLLSLAACQRSAPTVAAVNASAEATPSSSATMVAPGSPEGRRILLATRMGGCDHVVDEAGWERVHSRALVPMPNRLVLARDGGMKWNDIDVSPAQLKSQLAAAAVLDPKPYFVIVNDGVNGDTLLPVETAFAGSGFCQ